MSDATTADKDQFPSILFRLKMDYYAINCKHVASIMQMTDYERLPQTPENVIGIFKFMDQVIPIISLRQLFGHPSLEQEGKEFAQMLNQRKEDHIHWVKELNRCLRSGEPFTLATDPHKCAFGRWYDHYKPESQSIKYQLRKLEEPHRLLHETAQHAKECNQDHDACRREKCLKDILNQAENIYMPKILNLLEETKDAFEAHQRSMLIVIDTGSSTYAVTVDEVLAVEDLVDVAAEEQVDKLKGSRFITEIKKSQQSSRLVFVIDEIKLTEISENYRLEARV